MITEITNNDMSAVLAAPKAVVDFNATWCGPCSMLAPILEELSDEMDGQVAFFGVDTDENQALAIEYRVESIPTLILFENGQPVRQTVGYMDKEALKNFVEGK